MFNLYDFIFQRLIWRMIRVYFLWLDYWTLKEWKTAKYRIILSQHTSYLHKWLVHFLICWLLLFIFFSEIPKYKQAYNITPLTTWPTWIGILWKWAGMLNKLDGDGECKLALFYAIRNFLVNEIFHFLRLSQQIGCSFTWAAYSI